MEAQQCGRGDDGSATTMTEAVIVQQCKRHNGYSTPELNERLYLHHLGVAELNGLAAFTGCVVLYIDHNALSDLSGLAPLTRLDSLYVSCNALASLDSLPLLPSLHTLDVAHNHIASLACLDTAAPQLQTLLASHNRLQGLAGVQGLTQLLSLDVADNCIADAEKTGACLRSHRGTLRTLLLRGNEVCRSAPQHRKRTIAAFSALRFLDDYPVFPDERERAEAFVAGGASAEAEVRAAQHARAADEAREQFAYFGGVQAAQREARHRNGPETRPTAYYLAHAGAAAPPTAAATVDGDGDEDDDVIYVPAVHPPTHRDPVRV